MKKRRLKPISVGKSIKALSSKKTRGLIRQLHQINKGLSQQTLSTCSTALTKTSKDLVITDRGKLATYQQASALGASPQRGGDTSRWLVKQLVRLGLKGNEGTKEKLALLDVGALTHCYVKEAEWINVTAIDLNPQSEGIIKADFLNFTSSNKFNIVCLSLVLNFLGDAKLRGKTV